MRWKRKKRRQPRVKKPAEALEELNRRWFQHHKYLSMGEMLEKGLIDHEDTDWVEGFREEEKWLKMRGRKMTEDELRMNTLREWLSKKHPTVLKLWEGSFASLIDLDMYIEEYQGAIDQKLQAYLERENLQKGE